MPLIIVGLGIKSFAHLTKEAEKVIMESDKVLYLSNDKLYPKWIKEVSKKSESLNEIYFSEKKREDSYNALKDKVKMELSKVDNLCLAIYGHPAFFVQLTEKVSDCIADQYDFRVLPAISALDCLLADLVINPGHGGMQVMDATEMLVNKRYVDISSHIIIFQIAAIGLTGHHRCDNLMQGGLEILCEYLLKYYPKKHEVIFYKASQYPLMQPKIIRCFLSEAATTQVCEITTMYIPPLKEKFADETMVENIKLLFSNTDATS